MSPSAKSNQYVVDADVTLDERESGRLRSLRWYIANENIAARSAWRCFCDAMLLNFSSTVGLWNKEKEVMLSKYVVSLEQTMSAAIRTSLGEHMIWRSKRRCVELAEEKNRPIFSPAGRSSGNGKWSNKPPKYTLMVEEKG
jgi:hypothetical protein